MTKNARYRVMVVDDDPGILASFERVFHKHFQMSTFSDPMEALKVFSNGAPFAVVVSDMHMPGMDGIAFLSAIRDINPDTVRIMLTGDGDIQTAVNAVNEGNIFRFLTKPCESMVMAAALTGALKQYELITAERELLQKTLRGSIKVLTDVLSMTNPVAFNKASRIRGYAVRVAELLRLPDLWQYEIAAMLSQLGCLTVPLDTLEKYFSGVELNDAEKSMIRLHPQVGYELLSNIPRMETIANMIKLQQTVLSREHYHKPVGEIEPAIIGGLILKSCIEFELLLTLHSSMEVVLRRMSETSVVLVPEMLECFRSVTPVGHAADDCRFVKITELVDGMILAEAIVSKTGLLMIAGKGCEINPATRHRLLNFMRQNMIEPLAKVVVRK